METLSSNAVALASLTQNTKRRNLFFLRALLLLGLVPVIVYSSAGRGRAHITEGWPALSMTRLANTSATSATPPGSLVIDFETVPMPIVKSTSDGFTIFNQYESLGVKFPEKATIRESPAIARSGARV